MPEQKALWAVLQRSLIAIFVLFPGVPALGKVSSSIAFLASIYQHYNGSSVGVATGIALPNTKAVRGYFTVGLTSLIIDDRFAGTRDGEPAILNVDPFVGCQDWEISNLAIQVKEIGAKATGIITFINAGKPQKVVLELQRSSDGWRIAEIQWDYASLRGLFRSKAAYNGSENARVAEGDLLFQIDPVPYRLSVQQATADLSIAEAQLETRRRALGTERSNATIAKIRPKPPAKITN